MNIRYSLQKLRLAYEQILNDKEECVVNQDFAVAAELREVGISVKRVIVRLEHIMTEAPWIQQE